MPIPSLSPPFSVAASPSLISFTGLVASAPLTAVAAVAGGAGVCVVVGNGSGGRKVGGTVKRDIRFA